MQHSAENWGGGKRWRLLWDEPAAGSWNMAVDEALLISHARGEAPPTLRFYSWEPACLTLGRLQKAVHAPAHVPVVRRPTGGRAVWHDDEVTYSVVVRTDLLPPGETSVTASYRWLGRGFCRGLRALGVNASLDEGVAARAHSLANCFAVATGDCDFTVDGRKLIGAAQCRRDDTLLQHGALLLGMDPAQWEGLTGSGMDGAVSLRELGLNLGFQEVAQALAQGFAREHGVVFLPGTLSDQEQILAEQLQRNKYGCAEWNREGRATPELSPSQTGQVSQAPAQP